MTGIELIAKERQEQIEKHGFTVESDCERYGDVEFKRSPLLYAVVAIAIDRFGDFSKSWPDELCQKILNKPLIERLAIAGALIAAEIDRLQANESTNA